MKQDLGNTLVYMLDNGPGLGGNSVGLLGHLGLFSDTLFVNTKSILSGIASWTSSSSRSASRGKALFFRHRDCRPDVIEFYLSQVLPGPILRPDFPA